MPVEETRYVKVGKKEYCFRTSDRKIAIIAGFEIWRRRKKYPSEWVGLKILDTRMRGSRAFRWRTFEAAYSGVERRMARNREWTSFEEAYPEISERILKFMNSKYGEEN